jgi:ubiquinol-cytochrome c reductase cytochrome c1 subunit
MKTRILLAVVLLTSVPVLQAMATDAAPAPEQTIEGAAQATSPAGAEPAHAQGDPGSHGEAAAPHEGGGEAHPPGAHATVHPPKQHWHFDGMFGTYDKSAMQRGLKVYREVCSACHSLKRVYFRNLEALGYDEGQVKTIASEYTIQDGPNDDGEMFERSGLPSDRFTSPYPNDNAAKAMNNGALPPDLSLITKARHDGPNYVYGILTGYEPAPAGTVLLPGQNWNKYMPGHIIAMAKPMSDGQVAYEDGSPQTVEQYAHDVVNFLTWTADPYMEDRKRTGIKVLIFLAIFAGIMYAVKRRIWADVH